MAQPLSSHDILTVRRPAARVVLLCGGAAAIAIVLLATLALWFHYGTTVFFEMIATGFAACF
jgi:hypothetical protein